MIEAEIYQALGDAIAAVHPAIPVVWENVDAIPQPTFIAVEIVRTGRLSEAVAGDAPQHNGYAQVTVVTPAGEHSVNGLQLADQIAAAFPVGTSMDFGSGCVRIIRQPFVGQGYRDGPDWRTPVTIYYMGTV